MSDRRISLSSRTIFFIILGLLILAGVYAFLNSRIGQTALLVCCGGVVLLVVVGILSESGMRRPR
jgi:hypothetical protein